MPLCSTDDRRIAESSLFGSGSGWMHADNGILMSFGGSLTTSHTRTYRTCGMWVRKRAQLEDVRLHDLRHSVASFAGADGASSKKVRIIVGTTVARAVQNCLHTAQGFGIFLSCLRLLPRQCFTPLVGGGGVGIGCFLFIASRPLPFEAAGRYRSIQGSASTYCFEPKLSLNPTRLRPILPKGSASAQ